MTLEVAYVIGDFVLVATSFEASRARIMAYEVTQVDEGVAVGVWTVAVEGVEGVELVDLERSDCVLQRCMVVD